MICNRFYVLLAEMDDDEEDSDAAEKLWSRIEKSIVETADITIGRHRKKHKNMWISNKTLKLVEKKRQAKLLGGQSAARKDEFKKL